MATQDYDKDVFKQIWPELLIPRKEVLMPFAEMYHSGNQVEAIKAIREQFMKQDKELLLDMQAEIAEAYEKFKKNAAAAETAGKKASGNGTVVSGGGVVTAAAVAAATEEVVAE